MLTFFPILLIGAMAFLMFRSQRQRTKQAAAMQATLEPGKGVRTIGGMYALVKAVNDETIELEIAPGVTAHYIKSAIAVVLEPLEYDAIINGRPADDAELPAEDAAEVAIDGGETAEAKADAKPEEPKADSAKADGEAPESK